MPRSVAFRTTARQLRWAPFGVLLAGGLCYANSVAGVFLFDDQPRIVSNHVIRQGWEIGKTLFHVERPLVVLSFALNYQVSGLQVWSYHAVNIAIHLMAALVLFGIVRRTLSRGTLQTRYAGKAPWLAAIVALLWIVHPLQTESVTYICQRAESLMGLCFLLTLYGVQRGADAPQASWRWYGSALVACALGVASKAAMVMAPLVVLLYDRIFLSSSFKVIFRQRGLLYLALMAAWLEAAYLIVNSDDSIRTVGEATGITPLTYLLTQLDVIPHYLRLSMWPSPLVLDYEWAAVTTVGQILVPGTIVIGLLLMTLWALRDHPMLGFLGAWFFLTLAPTSSIIPIRDIAFEHRMYLPLAAVVVCVVIGIDHVLSRTSVAGGLRRAIAMALVAMATAALGMTTVYRNQAYASETRMWSDVIAYRPHNVRAHLNLGEALRKSGRLTEAMAAYLKALQLNPAYPQAWDAYGALLAEQGQYAEALTAISRAIALNPRLAIAHLNRGAVLMAQGHVEEALAACTHALQLKPAYAEAYGCVGVALAKQGRVAEGIEALFQAHRLNPADAEISSNLRALLTSTEPVVD